MSNYMMRISLTRPQKNFRYTSLRSGHGVGRGAINSTERSYFLPRKVASLLDTPYTAGNISKDIRTPRRLSSPDRDASSPICVSMPFAEKS